LSKTDETDEQNEQMNPNEGGPFSPRRLISRNKREVVPDASKLIITNIQDKEGWGPAFRRWFLRNNGPVVLLVTFVVAMSYYVPSKFYPQATELVFGMVVFGIIGSMTAAYEYEKRQDQSHNTFVDLIQIKLHETVVGREKGKDGNVETKVIVPKITERALYLAKDYMFEGKAGDPYKIEKYNCQIVGTFGKIIDVSTVDETGRIIIGEGDGDLPSGLIVKVAYPSRSDLSDEVKRADKLRKEGAIREDQFLQFKAMVDQYNLWRDKIIEYAQVEGISMIDIDKMSKKQRSFFVALAKDSMRYWNGTDQDPIPLKDWKQMDPSVALPKLLQIMRDYNDIRAEKLDLLINRESDKMEAELGATINLMRATGQSEEAITQFLVEQRKGLVSVSSRTEEEMEGDINAGSDE